MIVLSDPRWLWALALLPLLLLLEWNAVRRAERGLKGLVGARVPHPLLEQRRPGQRRIGIVLRLGALASLIIGAAGPEWGSELVRRSGSGSDIVFAIDVSASMDVRDVAPSRLAEARREALALLERVEGSRVAVVAFAGDAVRLCPLTQDLAAARLVLESLSSASVSEPGTDIGRALRMVLRVLPAGRREEQAVVLWTDGEDLQHGAGDAIPEVARVGVRVFTVGVGTPAGDVVPVLDDQGRATDVKRDENGAAVRSRLDEGLLRGLARQTRGGYFAASRPGGELPRLVGALGSVARSGRGTRLIERPVARFPLFAALAALLLAIELLRPRRQVPAAVRPEHPRRAATAKRAAAAAALLALAVMPATACAQSAWAKGDRAFHAGKFAAAESLYALRAARPSPPDVRVNRGSAAALAGRREEGEKDLASLTGAPGRAGEAARYNLGTLQGEDRQYDDALAMLRTALEKKPDDEDARWNYELLLRRKQEEQQRHDSKQKKEPQSSPSGKPDPSGKSPAPPNPNAPPQPNPGGQPNAPPQPSPQDQRNSPSGGQGMSRAQAEQLLGALQDLQRAEQQRQRKVRVMREQRGKDW
jgi:Ca-activated chloride channel family protein